MSEARQTELLEKIYKDMKPTPYAFEAVTVDNTAGGVGLTAATFDSSTRAHISLETAQIRYRVDGGAPTATVGHILEIGCMVELESASEIANFKAIRTGSTSGTIQVSYFL